VAGELLVVVAVPPGFHVYEIGNDYVLGRWRDEWDVEHIRLHQLMKQWAPCSFGGLAAQKGKHNECSSG
jgi:hypothetical protein